MKLKDYAKTLAKLAKQYPDAEVIYARDSEGNGFEPVVYLPAAGHYDTRLRLFSNEKPETVNCVCIN